VSDRASPLDREAVQRVVRSVLYEGYVLYPYRASALKNQRRWMFGTLQPSTDGEPSACRTECLVAGNETTRLEVRVRFLQPVQRLDPDGAWEEAVEREAILEGRALAELATAEQTAFDFPGGEETDGCIVRRRRPLRVAVERRAAALGGGIFRVSLAVANATVPAPRARPEDSRLAVVASAQTLLGVEDGRFVSLLDPPAALAETAAACRNVGTWPVLVGEPGTADAVLSSPIILYDHPQITPESAGDLFDLTEIDEILTLRIRALTEAERQDGRRLDPHARAVLDRAEALDTRALGRLHGAIRRGQHAPGLCVGARVRLHPRRRADILDVVLAGRAATIASIEQDVDGRVFVVVTVDDDPGRDLGAGGALAHRFFFEPDEVELLA